MCCSIVGGCKILFKQNKSKQINNLPKCATKVRSYYFSAPALYNLAIDGDAKIGWKQSYIGLDDVM